MSKAIVQLLKPELTDLGEFSVHRVLPHPARRRVGPWVFFDHAGPADFQPGEGINVRPHPHINLATVTYLFEGEVIHRDSLGSHQAIHPGAINLMVAGRGIVHSERERPEVKDSRHRLHGLQLWLALPEADEETDPGFYHYPAEAIPYLDVDGVPVRVLMGSAYGIASPVKTFAETLYVEAELETGQRLTLPEAEARAVYVATGNLSIEHTQIYEHTMAVLNTASEVTATAAAPSRIAVIGGEDVGERYVEWNFVSSRRERIQQAKADWKARSFPLVPGDDEEFIPLPE